MDPLHVSARLPSSHPSVSLRSQIDCWSPRRMTVGAESVSVSQPPHPPGPTSPAPPQSNCQRIFTANWRTRKVPLRASSRLTPSWLQASSVTDSAASVGEGNILMMGWSTLPCITHALHLPIQEWSLRVVITSHPHQRCSVGT